MMLMAAAITTGLIVADDDGDGDDDDAEKEGAEKLMNELKNIICVLILLLGQYWQYRRKTAAEWKMFVVY